MAVGRLQIAGSAAYRSLTLNADETRVSRLLYQVLGEHVRVAGLRIAV